MYDQVSYVSTESKQIFFSVDPSIFDSLDRDYVMSMIPSSSNLEIDIEKFLKYLPSLEAEIFYLSFYLNKYQKDIAVLLKLSQTTISYRYRRVIDKLSYLMIIDSADIKTEVGKFDFLKVRERNILVDLFYYLNQELVGKKYDTRQSSVKWIFIKTKRRLEALEIQDPDKWGNALGLIYLLNRNLNLRILYD